jgi:hypothetical protein
VAGDGETVRDIAWGSSDKASIKRQDVGGAGVDAIGGHKGRLLGQDVGELHIRLLVVIDAVTGTDDRGAFGRRLPGQRQTRRPVIAVPINQP